MALVYVGGVNATAQVVQLQTSAGGGGGAASFLQNAPTLAVIGTRSVVPQDSSTVTGATGTIDVTENCMNFITGPQIVTNIRLLYWAGGVKNAQGGWSAFQQGITIRAGLGTGAVTKTNLFTGAVESRAYAAGEIYATDIGVVASDLSIGSIGANSTLIARTGVPLNNGDIVWGGNATSVAVATKKDSTLSGLQATTPDQVPGVGDMSATGRTTTPVYGFTPIAILGNWVSTRDLSCMILGDSIAQGSGLTAANQTGTGNGNGGFLAQGMYTVRGANKPVPWSKMARPGDAVGALLTNTTYLRQMLQYYTDVFCNYFYNDAQSLGAAQELILANLITLARLCNAPNGAGQPGSRFHWCTPIPSLSATSDAYASLLGQTINTSYAAKATFVKAGMIAAASTDPVVAMQPNRFFGGVILSGEAMRDTVETDKVVVNGTANYGIATDNVHPTQNTHGLMAAPVTAYAAALSIP